MKREFETRVQELKNSVLRSVAQLAWEDRLSDGILDIPEQIIPGPESHTRCCVYKARAIVSSRIKIAMGGDKSDPCVVEVLPIACDECPVTEITVSPACRGCIATRCVNTCPKDAISIVNHRAVIDHSKCISCGKCVNACPYGAIVKNLRPCERGCKSGAISMGSDRKASINREKCISCGACVYQCPFGAIMDKSYILDAIDLLKGAEKGYYPVYAAIAPAIAGQFQESLGKVIAGLNALGFTHVAEVARGADLVALHESAELEEKEMLTSSCCPAFVEYVEKNHPHLKHLISSTPSPMVLLGKTIKEQHPEAKVVFIGPCIAKKHEAQLPKAGGSVDCVLTFEELHALFESRNIDISELEEIELDEASRFGRGFAVSGGVSAAVAEVLKETGSDFALKPVPCSGIDECKAALLKASKNLLDGNFIEGMACEGGCAQGPVALIRLPKNKTAVADYAKHASRQTIASAESTSQA